jgi:streptomycin 6-kinase
MTSAAAIPPLPTAWVAAITEHPAEGGPSGATWVPQVPRLIRQCLDQWDLVPDGPVRTGWTAAVLPVRRGEERLALKVVRPTRDTAGEPLALRHWAGRGAVLLVAADPARGALLLERLDAGRDLSGVDADTACAVIGTLLAQLHIPAPPGIRRMSRFTASHLAGFSARADIPRRFSARIEGLARELTADPSCDATLLHLDLHFQNVLAATRSPWIAIDPQPIAGHPGAELHPVFRNRVDELGTGSGFRWSVRRRLEVVCDAAVIDEDLARRWTMVLCGIQARWAAESGDRETVSFNIALAKALDD